MSIKKIYKYKTKYDYDPYFDYTITVNVLVKLNNFIQLDLDLDNKGNQNNIIIFYKNVYKYFIEYEQYKFYKRNTGNIDIYYSRYDNSYINNLLINIYFINKLLHKTCEKYYVVEYKNEFEYINTYEIDTIHNIKKINGYRFYKSLYYIA